MSVTPQQHEEELNVFVTPIPTLEEILIAVWKHGSASVGAVHPGGTQTINPAEAKAAIQRLFTAERLDELKSIEYTDLDDLVGTEVVLRSRIDNRAAELQQQIEGR